MLLLLLVEVEEAGMCHLMGRWALEEEVEGEQGHFPLQEEGEVGGEMWVRSRKVSGGTRCLLLEEAEEVAEQWYSDLKSQQAEVEVVCRCQPQFARWEQKVEARRCRGWICSQDKEKKHLQRLNTLRV